MRIKGSDPAFPTTAGDWGLSVRAWLIGQALAGKAIGNMQPYDVIATVRSACALADAALAEINKEST